MVARPWRLLQWLDSGFPTGAYAHSAGLEAWAHVAPERADVGAALRAMTITQAELALPFVRAAFVCGLAGESFTELDRTFDASVWGRSANRASRAQGRALLQVTVRSFPDDAQVQSAREWLRPEAPLHLPVVFGALARAFSVDADEVARVFAFCAARAMTSAAVRLNLLGPFEAQRVLSTLGDVAERAAARARERPIHAAASASPWLDLVTEQHERLHTRLFAT